MYVITKHLFSFCTVVLLLTVFSSNSVLALPTGFSNELVVQNLNQPVSMTTLPTGEMLILERGGRILIMDPSQAVPSTSLYLQLPDVDTEGEKGLLDIALDADFANNQYFYLYYHNSVADRARISRFTHDIDHANLQDEVLVWEDHQTDGLQVIADHWGGGLDTGPDGDVYLTLGDKKDYPLESQDLSLSAGKIIRIDPSTVDTLGGWVRDGDNTHLIPTSNPYIDGPGGNLDEIWASGLRNPFRAKWDVPTSRLFISEVGSNVQEGPDASYEDLHMVTLADGGGANFAWPTCEGPVCSGPLPLNYSAPLYSAQHPDTRALIAGMVYRDNLYPQAYSEAFFITDYQYGWLRYITFDENGNVSADVPAGGFVFADSGELGHPVALEVGPEGAIYYCSISDGQVGRITYNNGNLPPVITQATADITSASTAPVTINFNALATDPESDPVSYLWDFGDGMQSTSSDVAHDYTANGEYNARLSASDAAHSTLSDPVLIEIGQAPLVNLTAPVAGQLFRAGDIIAFKGDASDTDGTLTNDDLRWTIQFKHDAHFHPVITDAAGMPCAPTGSSCFSFTVPTSSHGFDGDTGFKITFSVSDSDGLQREQNVIILPDTVSLTFNSNVPGGVSVSVDQVPRKEPFMIDSLIDFTHTIEVPMSVVASGYQYVFDSWSNGVTTNSQGITVPDSDTTYTANYINVGPQPRVSDGLQVLYAFEAGAGNTIYDVSGVGQPLDLTINNPADVSWQVGALSVDQSTLITSLSAATKLHNAITATDEMTLEAWLTPANTTQNGPARIISLSQDTAARNVTLGQGSPGNPSGDDYDLRLRTTTTGTNGASPSLSSPAGSLSTTLTHVVYTRDAGNRARMFIDNVLVASELIDGDLSNWDAGYLLSLGNEVSGDRPWLGTLDLVAIYNRALSIDEISYNFYQGADSSSGRIPPLVISTAELPDTVQASSYDQTISASGGTVPYSWTVDSGALPDGLLLDPVAGIISGVSSVAGDFPFTLKITDATGATTTQSYSISVLLDTDGDMLPDVDEVNVYGTNPALADTDGDGFDDGDEINTYGTDPLLLNLLGDIAPRGTPDGVINAADVLIMHQLVIWQVAPDASEILLADINQDGLIDSGDLVLSIRLALGLLVLP